MLSGKRNEIHNSGFSLIPLKNIEDYRDRNIILFDCGRADLNEFFHCDAYDYLNELLAVTYYFQPVEATRNGIFFPVALISLLNDRIEIERGERKGDKKRLYKEIKKNVPFPKRNHTLFPSVKIGRLGVRKEYQKLGIGTNLINMIKELFLVNNRTGCRFLTVDAYNDNKTLQFYIDKNEFIPLWDEDKDEKTRILYFDLKNYEPENNLSI